MKMIKCFLDYLARYQRQPSNFVEEKEGYAITLTLIAFPLILGMAAWTIDGARVVNLHTDLQHAADAMALAGARELDGRDDAIPRARAAIAALTENQAAFAGGSGAEGLGTLVDVSFDPNNDAGSSVTVEFLKTIPDNDQTPIGAGNLVANPNTSAGSNDAVYVRVIARPQTVNTIFPLPALGLDTVDVGAEAVATYTASACDVTPIFICNPFEGDGTSFNQHFANGDFYAKEFRLRNSANSSPGPGNFGFLRTNGNGANVLADALATGAPGVCFRRQGLDTEPGAQVGPVEQGLNTRFGIYQGSYGNNDNLAAYRPDVNVRKGQEQGGGNGNGNGNGNGGANAEICSSYSPESNVLNATPTPEGDSVTVIGGGSFSSSQWNLNQYWDISHGTHGVPPADQQNYSPPPAPAAVQNFRPSYPPTATTSSPRPSRFDVYLYEITNGLVGDAAPNGETGQTMCHALGQAPGRREVFSAVINCNQHADLIQGAARDVPSVAFARMFLSRPAVTNGNDRFLSLELIDVTGQGGLGTVEDLLREEAELVR